MPPSSTWGLKGCLLISQGSRNSLKSVRCERKEDIMSQSAAKHRLWGRASCLKEPALLQCHCPSCVTLLLLSEPRFTSCAKPGLGWIKEDDKVLAHNVR